MRTIHKTTEFQEVLCGSYELCVDSFALKFHDTYVFKDITHMFKRGTLTLLKGKNGVGKTCLLQCLCSIIPNHFDAVIEGIVNLMYTPLSDSGETQSILLYENVKESADRLSLKQSERNCNKDIISRYFGYLMQDPDKQLCFPFIDEELFFGAENLNRNKIEFDKDYEMLINEFPILKQAEVETSDLSYGQKKVLLFSAMILKDPLVYLLDEPIAGLSKEYRDKFSKLITILKNKGKIIIMAEHDSFFDKIADGHLLLEQ